MAKESAKLTGRSFLALFPVGVESKFQSFTIAPRVPKKANSLSQFEIPLTGNCQHHDLKLNCE
jgi:hypothetical protein